jgi:ApaG protein
MSDAMASSVRVSVEARYIAEQSSPEQHQYLFAYHVTITNDGAEPVQLISRHWIITDGAGRIEEVKGSGVVGQQPRIPPGDSFEYTSGCPLRTPVGTMEGSYHMVTDDGRKFEAPIAPFTLACPEALN